MSYLKECFCYTVLLGLYQWIVRSYQTSRLHDYMEKLFGFLSKKWEESFFVHLFYEESALTKAYPTSIFCRAADALLNLPLRVLQWFYGLFRKPLEGSGFARLGIKVGTEAYLAAGWFIALVMSIPYSAWDNAYSLILFVFVLLLLYLGSMNRTGYRFSVKACGPYFLLYFFATIMAVPLSVYTDLSFRYLFYHISGLIAVIAMVNAIENSRQLLRLAMGLGIGVLTAAGYGLFQFFVIGVEVNETFVDVSVNADMPGRVYSFYENPNALGELLVLALPILVALIFSAKRLISKFAALGVFCIGLVCLGLTGSRGSWVGLCVAAFLYVFFWYRRLIPLGIAAAIAIIPLLPDFIWNRILTITNFDDSSISSRFPQYEAVIKSLFERPLLGVGLGADAVRQYVAAGGHYQGDAPFVHAHNTFLQIWVETGLLGLVSFLLLLFWLMKSMARAIKKTHDSVAKHIAIGGAAATFGMAVCGLADYVWTYPRIMFIFWFVVGLTFSAIKCCNDDKSVL